jgi:hypothetical protein
VLNGVLVGSTVEVFGATGGGDLGTATTDANGRYSAQVSRAGPYRLRATGGKLNGSDYTGTLEAFCSAASGCFVTPYTTVLLRLIDEHGFNLGDATALLTNSLGFDGDPFADGPVADFDLDAARAAIAGGDGLAEWVASVVQWATDPEAPPPPGAGGFGPAPPPVPPDPDPDPVPPQDPDPDPEPVPDPDPDPIAPVTYAVSTSASTGGSISPTSRSVSRGATTTFEVVPEIGYIIATVSGCGGSLIGTTYTTGTITGACTVSASFNLKTYGVTATASPGGSISPSYQLTIPGTVVVFDLQRDPGFGISRVTGCDGARIGNTYTTGPIVGPCAVEAVFGEFVVFGTNPINDSGIDWCADGANNYDAGDAAYKDIQCDAVTNAGFPGQDGHFGRDALARTGQLPKIGDGAAGFDFTKISNSGNELPATATLGSGPNDWACTRDNVTGLIWEVKVTDSTHLRYQGNWYTWYFPDSPDGNPGRQNGGICVGSDCDTTGFLEAVNAEGLCGASDWRVPTRRELQGIVNYGRANFAIDPEYFPNIYPGDSGFWSSSVFAQPDFGQAWMVGLQLHFSGGSALSYERDSRGSIRVVRDGT